MKQISILAILLAVFLLASCEKDDQATGIGDALVVVKKSGANTVYGISLYAYTYSTFTSVSAVSSAEPEKTYTLKSNKDYFGYETPETQYSVTKPAATTYTFSATFNNGVQQDFQDTLTADVLAVPTIDKCEYNELYQRLELNWRILPKAVSYAINIFDGTRIVYASGEINVNDLISPDTQLPVGAYVIKSMGGGWAQGFVPVSGKTYKIRLFAYQYEPQGGSYHFQCISMADTSVEWGY